MEQKHSPLPWSYIPADPSVGRKDWIEDGNGDIQLENIGHLDGPHIVLCVNAHDQLVRALEGMLNIFDREGSAPRKRASGEDCLSIGARECDSARAALLLAKGS